MPATWNIEFLAHNKVRRFPLAAEATAVDTTGTFTLPDSFLAGLDLPIHTAMDTEPGQFFLRSLGLHPTGFVFIFAYQGTNGVVDVATAMVPRGSFAPFKSFPLGGLSPFDDTQGTVALGSLDDIDRQPPGIWYFDLAGARIEPFCTRPSLRGVTGLVVTNGTEQSTRITGDVELIAGTNIQLTLAQVEGQDPQIIISAISGEGTLQNCICQGEENLAPCIRRVNGVSGTSAGDFYLLGDNCFQFTEITNGLKLTDKCCQPCCSCPELEAITSDLSLLKSERDTFTVFMQQLTTQVNQMELTVLGARLNDQGCTTC